MRCAWAARPNGRTTRNTDNSPPARSCCCAETRRYRSWRCGSSPSITPGRGPKVPLRDDLLNPIPGDNPSGASLRYEKVYDQIKEARTEGDASILGNLAAPKRADLNLVIKLGGEALATKSKDLQLAAWLVEAHTKKEGIGLVQPCLKLLKDLQEQFWDTLYPPIEDGDVGLRAVPIEWAFNRLDEILR